MATRQEGPTFFTLEEANQMLPKVHERLLGLRAQREKIRKVDQQKAVEELCWLQEDGTVSPKAKQQAGLLEESLDKEVKLFEQQLEQLALLGVELKDLDDGLVDFYAVREDKLVYLCWKEGEDQIRHWHDLESGFAGRRPMAEF